MEDLIKKYLDEKNTKLYNDLKEKFDISLTKYEPREDGNNRLWLMSFQQNVYRIGYYEDITSTGFFTHELFHIDLIDKGFSDFSEILPLIKEGNKNYVFSPIIGHLNNVFAHERFYSDFINLGYLPSEFVSDYNTPINLTNIISDIENANLKYKLPHSDISACIRYYFTAKDNRNPIKEKTYNEVLNYIKSKNHNLYNILDNNWVSWQNSNSLSSKDFLNHLFEQTEILLEKGA